MASNNPYADLGATPVEDDYSDLGAVLVEEKKAPDNPYADLGAVLVEDAVATPPPGKELEDRLNAEKAAQKDAQAKQLVAQQAEQQKAADPSNWTSAKLAEHYKQNPPQTIEEQAQANLHIENKKKQESALVEQQKRREADSTLDQDPSNWTSAQLVNYYKQNPPQTVQEQAQANLHVENKKKQERSLIEQQIKTPTPGYTGAPAGAPDVSPEVQSVPPEAGVPETDHQVERVPASSVTPEAESRPEYDLPFAEASKLALRFGFGAPGAVSSVIQKVAGLSASVSEKIQREEPEKQREFLEKLSPEVAKALQQSTNLILGFELPGVGKVSGIRQALAAERGFVKSVKASPQVSPEIIEKLNTPQNLYNPISNQATLARAKQIISENPDEAFRRVMSSEPATPELNATGQLLIQEFQKAGQYENAVQVVERVAEKATGQGQAIQALSLWGRLTPEGMLRYAQRTLDRAQANLPKAAKRLGLSAKQAQEIMENAGRISQMAEGREKSMAIAALLGNIHDLVPTSLASKLSEFQIFAQLMNPKTAVRNILGNVGFAGIENIKDVVATPLDALVSVFSGARTKGLPSLAAQFKGAKRGFREAAEEVSRGVNLKNVATQFELPKTPAFKGRVGRAAHKFLNYELLVPDRAAYSSAYRQSLLEQFKTSGARRITDEMREIAHQDGLYRTFQDESVVAKMFMGLKRGLNVGQKFGLGDLILKYPKTPGNLIARAIDYTPVGFVNSVFQLGKATVGKGFNQRAFVEATSRAFIGTGIVGTGALLHRLGIITGKRPQDKDIAQLQRETGLGEYRLNISALKRFINSGLDAKSAELEPGDTMVSYDWFQPQAVPVAMGANIDETSGKAGGAVQTLGKAFLAIEAGTTTLAEQPLISNFTRMFQGYNLAESVINTIGSAPASFVPTLLNQVRTLVNNAQPETYSPDPLEQGVNRALMKVPGLEKTLPQKAGVFGNSVEVYKDGTNSIFNVFLNPAFVTKYAPTPEAKMVMDIYRNIGETKQAPRMVKKSITIEGENIPLKPREYVALQTVTGKLSMHIFRNLALNERFQAVPDEQKAEYLGKILTAVGTVGKTVVLGHNPKTITQEARDAYGLAKQLGLLEKFGEVRRGFESRLPRIKAE